jgi:hypothetical protein
MDHFLNRPLKYNERVQKFGGPNFQAPNKLSGRFALEFRLSNLPVLLLRFIAFSALVYTQPFNVQARIFPASISRANGVRLHVCFSRIHYWHSPINATQDGILAAAS